MGRKVINKNALLSRVNNQDFLSREKLDEAVRKKAHELYLERGCKQGRALDDWLEAERRVAGR